MPKPKSKARPAARVARANSLAAAQSEVLKEFDRVVDERLGALLGRGNRKRLRSDLAIATQLGKGVVVHAGVQSKTPMTIERIRREKPIVGAMASTLPLIDPVSLTALAPGAYVVRMRALGVDKFAFDFFPGKGKPVFSGVADVARQIGPDYTGTLGNLADVEIELPWDPDGMFPPETDDLHGQFCISFLRWKHCWSWDWPDIDWPW